MSDLPLPGRPGGRMSSRPLHFIWLVDGSGSMRMHGKIEALNQAINEAIPHMQRVARENPQAAVFVNAITFADGARWMEEKLTPVSEFQWQNMEAGGATALGEALTMVGDVLQPPLITDRALPPVLALVTDGLPTDDFQAGLNHLLSKPWGRQAVRVVVGIGEDSTSDDARNFFKSFTNNGALEPFQANCPDELIGAVRWVSTVVLKSVVAPLSQEATGADRKPAEMSYGVEMEIPDEAVVW